MKNLKDLFKASHQVLETICRIFYYRNGTTVQQFCAEIVNVMNMNYHKIKTLVIYGPFDTGKSLIANLVSNLFEPYEIGAISAPCGQTPSDI